MLGAVVVGAALAAIAAASPGDTLTLGAGVHRGPLHVDRAIVLRGEPGAVVDGGGSGTVLSVTAGGAVVEDLELRGSGRDIMNADAGIHVRSCAGVRLQRLRIHDVLYGVHAERATGLEIRDCALTGRVEPMTERGDGNGLHFWYCDNVTLSHNQVDRFLDAIYLSFTHRSRIEGNRLEWSGRYGLHTMYCQDNRLERNVFTHNVAGCALMFSNGLEVESNQFVRNRGPRTYGLLLRDCSAGTFTNNLLADNTIALFMDGSNRNRFRGNQVRNNGWGLLLFASCAANEFADNQFVHNDVPVALDMRRTSNRFDDGEIGNYWSDHAAFDLDGDGVGDVPHWPVTAFAFVSKQNPDLAILAKSPAVAALAVAERVVPSLRPSEAVDRFPRVQPLRGQATALERRTEPAPRPAWGAALVFGLVGAAGVAGLSGGRRVRGES